MILYPFTIYFFFYKHYYQIKRVCTKLLRWAMLIFKSVLVIFSNNALNMFFSNFKHLSR